MLGCWSTVCSGLRVGASERGPCDACAAGWQGLQGSFSYVLGLALKSRPGPMPLSLFTSDFCRVCQRQRVERRRCQQQRAGGQRHRHGLRPVVGFCRVRFEPCGCLFGLAHAVGQEHTHGFRLMVGFC